MKIGFILGGLPRVSNESFNSFKDKVVNILAEDNELRFSVVTDLKFLSKWNHIIFDHPTIINITEHNSNFEESIFSQLNRFPKDSNNYYNQFRHLYSSYHNLKTFQEQFDWILKIRLDLIYVENFDINLLKENTKTLMMSQKEFHADSFDPINSCNDQFWVSYPETMETIVNMIFDQFFKFDPSLKIEDIIRKYMYYKKIDLKIFNKSFLYDKDYSIISEGQYDIMF